MFLTSKAKLIFSSLMIVLSFLMVAPVVLAAPTADSTGLNETAKQGFGAVPAETSLPLIIGKVVGAVLAFLGLIFFCLILYAGLSWILSMGKEEKINEAKEMIIAAVLGLMVVLGAYAITNLLSKIFSEAIQK